MANFEKLLTRSLKLHEEESALKKLMCSFERTEALKYVIEKHSTPYNVFPCGYLPSRKELDSHSSSNVLFNLVKEGYMITVGMEALLNRYCMLLRRGRWRIPKFLQPTFRGHDGSLKAGKDGDVLIWNGSNPSYYVALIMRDCIPVFNDILPDVNYAALTTLKDVPLFYKTFH